MLGTNTSLGSIFRPGSVADEKFCRRELDYSTIDAEKKRAVAAWHDSVIELLCAQGVRYMKLDFVCPTASPDGCLGFSDSRGAVAAYHDAIERSACARGRMRLGLSWYLDWSRADNWDVWTSSAESVRTDEDINNLVPKNESKHEGQKLTAFGTVQRAIERYR